MISPLQSRAARGWLDWRQADLAKHSHVSLSTIRDFEGGLRLPGAPILAALEQAFFKKGIHFLIDQDGNPKGITGPIDKGGKSRQRSTSIVDADSHEINRP